MPFGLLRKTLTPRRAPIKEREHEVAGRTLPLRIVENERARRLTLRIDAGGRGLRITVPPGVPSRDVWKFLYRHQDWLEERLAKVPKRPKVRVGIKIPFRGVPHKIIHVPDQRGTVTQGEFEGVPALFVYGDREHLPRRLADFLKRQAKKDIERYVARHTAAIGKRAKAIRYRDTTSRWGSCTADGILSFSWRIMMAPPPVIEYLVAHEVSHLKEMNHGPKFWKLCEKLFPDTERCKDWLRRNGNALQAIQFD